MKNILLITFLSIGFCNAAIADGCNDAESLYQEVASQSQTKQLEALRDILKICPEHAVSLNHLGLIFEEQSKLDKAYDYYKKAIDAAPEYPAPYAGVADIEFAKRQYQSASSSYQQFLTVLSASIDQGDPYQLAQYEASYRAKLYHCNQLLEKAQQDHVAAQAISARRIISANKIIESLTLDSSKRNIALSDGIEPELSIDIPIQFDFDSAEITETSIDQLKEIALALTDDSLVNSQIRIEGHTDADGSAEYNLKLSEQRANAVKLHLVSKYQLYGDRFQVVGMGENAPLESNATEDGRAVNRRVKLINLNKN